MKVISDENWSEFSLKQVELLKTAGFSHTEALRLFPAVQ